MGNREDNYEVIVSKSNFTAIFLGSETSQNLIRASGGIFRLSLSLLRNEYV